MEFWKLATALGGLSFAGPLAVLVAVLMAARGRISLALYWCLLFGSGMLIVVATKVAFLGWGIGIREWGMAGISGHAARAAAIFPVVCFLLFQDSGKKRVLNAAVVAGMAIGLLASWSRYEVRAHTVSESLFGFALGTAVALLFIQRALHEPRIQLRVVLLALCAALVLLKPEREPVDTEKWITVLAMKLAGHDRPYQRWSWQPKRQPYTVRCKPPEVLRGYGCYWPKGNH
ncbi:phosphatase PAP2 family protein [Pseudoduganella sp. GCM10020061]|jgi:hypothetical protein|uniref:phosphatase PAP2 family protein n=1 Tax=Pseudoduganella sp. GCM10020061 TaxID=3317345 RepID=UPI0036369C2E